ncbi:MAG: Asp-tRNA(Asn)/Glu-tRNA(Gln) amidotransferase subunit GatC [Puniceicoccales bacterium]|jgi:aspartyl-tRNA(Asn)/glutamyl-tRNA(Gln) amidotransferase subunit C|nr:Asp-tRNA(Asn)/Glu-tRNA(Gln) amidotransferase subunit GatC [Puniceicoccales bacterium]
MPSLLRSPPRQTFKENHQSGEPFKKNKFLSHDNTLFRTGGILLTHIFPLPSGSFQNRKLIQSTMTPKKRHMNVDAIAELARIELTDGERQRFGEQLEKILDYIDILQLINVDGVEPSAHAFEVVNVWRKDVVETSFPPEVALQNAPERKDGQICVPKIVDDA